MEKEREGGWEEGNIEEEEEEEVGERKEKEPGSQTAYTQ